MAVAQVVIRNTVAVVLTWDAKAGVVQDSFACRIRSLYSPHLCSYHWYPIVALGHYRVLGQQYQYQGPLNTMSCIKLSIIYRWLRARSLFVRIIYLKLSLPVPVGHAVNLFQNGRCSMEASGIHLLYRLLHVSFESYDIVCIVLGLILKEFSLTSKFINEKKWHPSLFNPKRGKWIDNAYYIWTTW